MHSRIILLLLLLPSILCAETWYVDPGNTHGATWNGTNGTAYVCANGTGKGSNTIQYVVFGTDGTDYAAAVGDTIYLRGGTYTETYGGTSSTGGAAMQISLSLNGTAWTAGNFTTLASYPGEWAIIQGDNGASGHYYALGFGSLSSGDSYSYQLKYWKFERLEITQGSGFGLAATGGPIWVRYCYIHDNGRGSVGDGNRSGLALLRARECIVEYNYFYANATAANGNNNTHVYISSDYAWASFQIASASWKNIVRYNYMLHDATGPYLGIKRKADQMLTGYDAASQYDHPCVEEETTYREYGDEYHHNIIDVATMGIMDVQDYSKIHHNILSGCRIEGEEGADFWMHHGQNWWNNTIIGGQMRFSIGRNKACETITPKFFCVNNIISGASPDTYYAPLSIATMQCGGTGCDQSGEEQMAWTDTTINMNLIHNPGAGDHIAESASSYAECNSSNDHCGKWYTVTEFNAKHSTTNYNNATSGLFDETTGFITNGSFVVGSSTIANGGYNAAHPYLSGVTIPAYLGATNPSDNDWVAGVLGLATDSNEDGIPDNLLSATAGSDPTWIEGSGSSPSTPSLHGVSLHSVDMH